MYMDRSAECVTLSSSPFNIMQLSMMLLVRDTLAADAPCFNADVMQNFAMSISLVFIILMQKNVLIILLRLSGCSPAL